MTTEIELEREIREASIRIEERQSKIESELDNLSKKIIKFTFWAWGFVWVGFAVGVFSIIMFYYTNTEKEFGLNLLGDFLSGAVASIWSLAGLFFIYVAFLGQKQQLLNQQLEIMYSQLEVKYTRLELAGQKLEMKEQNETLKLQKFENTFFNLLSLHHQIVDGIDEIEAMETSKGVRNLLKERSFASHINKNENRTIEHITIKGRDVFKNSYQYLMNRIESNSGNNFLDNYLIVYSAVQTDFGHYFRNLYRIIKFIFETQFTDDQKENFKIQYKYTSMVRAQLSDYELLWLFYNCLSSNGKEKFKPYIEEFALFKNLPKEKLHNQGLIAEYDKNAYGK
ncbi:putative phage abortive infection protein [uncultured Chryseobacterium sp.]|uniref:putative phage abortive infection protein n=1 Tax=uncultured Chryseobacterium sp. TaxID=259322 RepID=UPI0025E3E09C|nr:putative phage abortive infection protein [uncultured Chryseobacterium sp.]